MADTKRQPVQINEGTVLRLRDYSTVTGVPMAHVVDKALTEWLDKNASTHMRVLAVKPTKK